MVGDIFYICNKLFTLNDDWRRNGDLYEKCSFF